MPETNLIESGVTGNVKAAMKAAGAPSSDLWMVPYDKLKIAPGFNVRSRDDEYEAHIQYLTGQMVENGYRKDKPMAGYVVVEDGESVIYVTDGHSRHEAVGRAIALGAKIEAVSVVTAERGTSAEDLVVALVTSNSGKPLKPLEIAAVCKRLQGYGLDEKTIAARLGYTVAYVKQILDLLGAPKAVRDLVSAGKVSATLATQTIKKHGKDAAKKLSESVAKAVSTGKKKVTKKDVIASGPKPAELIAIIKGLLTVIENAGGTTICRDKDEIDNLAQAHNIIKEDEL